MTRRGQNKSARQSSNNFQSADPENDETDYDFDYTDIGNQVVSVLPSTSRAAELSRTRLQKKTQLSQRQKSTSQQPNRRKQRNPASMRTRMLREIVRLQKSKSFMIPKLPFGRLVRELIYDNTRENVHMITKTALEALQESVETYMTQILSDAYMLTLHRKRVTLHPDDLKLLMLFRCIQ